MRIALTSFILAAFGFGQAPAPAAVQPVRVLSFNIRYDNPGDGLDRWPLRRRLVEGVVRYHRPDVLGVQEALPHQVDELALGLPEYDSFGVGRDGGRKGEHSTIYYRRARLDLVDQGTFWLSRTPDEISNDWGAGLRRICTWGSFRDLVSGQPFFVFNTHFDHQSALARAESAKLIRRRIAALGGEAAVVLLGDLNCLDSSPPYRALVGEPTQAGVLFDAARVSLEPSYGPSGTFSGFGRGELAGRRIDYVMVRGPVTVERYATLSDTRDGRTPSDHRPVLADLTIGPPADRSRLELRTWSFRTDAERTGTEAGFGGEAVAGEGWKTVVAGEPWEGQGFADYDGVAWYRCEPNLPVDWEGRGVHLVLDRVADRARLWLNGAEVWDSDGAQGGADGRWIAVQLPEALLRFGRENSFALRVEERGLAGGLVSAVPALVAGRR